jgi:putative phage-type endonuclease
MTINEFIGVFSPLFIQEIRLFLNTDMKRGMSSKTTIIEKDEHCTGSYLNQLECSKQVFNFYVENYKILTKRTLAIIYEKVFMSLLNSDGITYEGNKVGDVMKGIYQLTKIGFHNLISYGVYHHPEVVEFLHDINKTYVSHCKNQITYLDDIPHIEQKTEEWFAIRKNMISASVAGYVDSNDCGVGISKEYEQVKEKTELKPKKNYSWSCFPLRHGQQYEDVAGHVYDTFNGLVSKEYGILPDSHYSHIGASPDGIIIGVKDETNFNYGRMMGRMREIKNPVSRKINFKIPSFYYWQMQQQLYVCNLPICDFIQTSFKYESKGECNTYSNFKGDCFDMENLVNAKCWQDIKNHLAGYILENLHFDVFWNYLVEYNVINQPLDDIENEIVAIFVNEFSYISPIPVINLTKTGFLKGVMWCLTKQDDEGNVDFKVQWTPLNIGIDNEQYLNDMEKDFVTTFEGDGFKLDEKHFWYLEDYKVIEVEYNQNLYEGKNFINNNENRRDEHHNDNCIIKRLGEKWNIIKELRGIQNLDDRKKKYYEYYPNDNSNSNSNKKYGRSRYKSKYKKKTSDNCGSNNNWSVRDKDVIYDLS